MRKGHVVNDKPTLIYFAEVWKMFDDPPAGPIKIGTAEKPIARVKNLQVGNHEIVSLVAWKEGSTREERELHKRFSDFRIHGEWFKPVDELRYWIFKNCHCSLGFALEFADEVTDQMQQEWNEAREARTA